MGRTLLVAALLGLVAAPARAEWTHTDTALELSYAAFHVSDWLQTRTIAAHPDIWDEQLNRVLGRHPSLVQVDAYFAVTLAAHATVSYVLPKRYRHAWQVSGIGVEAYMVVRNHKAGINFTLPW